jgi:hypothetical protein
MGLHRDAAGHNFTVEEVEERRLLFWECQTTDVFAVRRLAHSYVSWLITAKAQCALRP